MQLPHLVEQVLRDLSRVSADKSRRLRVNLSVRVREVGGEDIDVGDLVAYLEEKSLIEDVENRGGTYYGRISRRGLDYLKPDGA